MTHDRPVSIITGAVGNLGAAVARAFLNAGHRTVLVDHAPDRLGPAFPEIANSPDHLLVGGIDVTDATALSKLVAGARSRFGRIDALVNTVGGWRGGKPVHEEDLEIWDSLFQINVRTTLMCCRAVAPVMLHQGHGKIVNVASRAALQGVAGNAASCAAKSAVVRLTESLSAELKAANVNVNCVLPGTIDTPQNRAAWPSAKFDKWVEPAAIADVILFLVSDAARSIHGAAVPVYGKG
jgi:NAD(P)-dependent dehydrogenase (short-subunit alcohol dehydrogenase family)